MVLIGTHSGQDGSKTTSRSNRQAAQSKKRISYLTLFLFFLPFNDLRVNLNHIIEWFQLKFQTKDLYLEFLESQVIRDNKKIRKDNYNGSNNNNNVFLRILENPCSLYGHSFPIGNISAFFAANFVPYTGGGLYTRIGLEEDRS